MGGVRTHEHGSMYYQCMYDSNDHSMVKFDHEGMTYGTERSMVDEIS